MRTARQFCTHVSKLALGSLFSIFLAMPFVAHATDVQFVGGATYAFVDDFANLTAQKVANFTSGGTSGTLHLELWAFPSPYNGSGSGYKLAMYSLGTLQGGFSFSNIVSGDVAYTSPPPGAWYYSMLLTEFTGAPSNGGYVVDDNINFSNAVVVGGGSSPGLLANPGPINFGTVTVGGSAQMSVPLSNIGGSTVSITTVALSDTSDYSLNTSGCSGELPPSTTCDVSVTYNPLAAGAQPATLTIGYSGGTAGSTNEMLVIALNGTGTTVGPPPALTPQIGLWWNPNESGSGYAIDYKHGVIVMTVYSYTTTGLPQWYLAFGPLSGDTWTGTLFKYTNGQCISCAYQPELDNGSNDGTVTVVFSSPTAGTMYLPGGRVTQIQPQAF
jgi:hypothetical protein